MSFVKECGRDGWKSMYTPCYSYRGKFMNSSMDSHRVYPPMLLVATLDALMDSDKSTSMEVWDSDSSFRVGILTAPSNVGILTVHEDGDSATAQGCDSDIAPGLEF